MCGWMVRRSVSGSILRAEALVIFVVAVDEQQVQTQLGELGFEADEEPLGLAAGSPEPEVAEMHDHHRWPRKPQADRLN